MIHLLKKYQMDTIARTTRQLGSAIQRYRQQKDLTQGALGDRVKVRQATISKLEAGAPATQLRILMDAIAALDLELVIRPRSKASVADIADIF
jgi:HTH-type transcriptional regulator/antitoxin HipB